MTMEDTFAELKAKYERFLKNDEDPLALKRDAEKLLAEAKAKGHHKIAEEIEEILIDLTFSVEEMKCNCPLSSKCRC